jgi:beta-galactosidase
VELILNGKSLGSKEMPKNEYLQWWVHYEPGKLEARAYSGDTLIATDVVQTTGAAAGIRLEADMLEIVADNENVAPVEVSILDADGHVVPTADNEVVFTVSGPGTVAGVGNGDPACLERDKASKRSAFNGHCMVVVQATDEPGEITLTATIPGVTSSSIQLTTVRSDIAVFE